MGQSSSMGLQVTSLKDGRSGLLGLCRVSPTNDDELEHGPDWCGLGISGSHAVLLNSASLYALPCAKELRRDLSIGLTRLKIGQGMA